MKAAQNRHRKQKRVASIAGSEALSHFGPFACRFDANFLEIVQTSA